MTRQDKDRLLEYIQDYKHKMICDSMKCTDSEKLDDYMIRIDEITNVQILIRDMVTE